MLMLQQWAFQRIGGTSHFGNNAMPYIAYAQTIAYAPIGYRLHYESGSVSPSGRLRPSVPDILVLFCI